MNRARAFSFFIAQKRKGKTMEPGTGTSVLSALVWKAIGGLAGVGAFGAGLSAVVVMCLLRPRTNAEWTVGLISTLISSISGGAAVVQYFDMHHWAENSVGLVAMLGIVFACGLPGWALVRWGFNFFDKRRKSDIFDVVQEAREMVLNGSKRSGEE